MSDTTHLTPDNDARWWHACDHPERPADPFAVYAFGCDPCYLALQVAAVTRPGAVAEEFTPENEVVRRTTMADVLATAREWRAAEGLRV